MDHGRNGRQGDLEEQLYVSGEWFSLAEWLHQHYRHLDGWDMNKNSITKAQYLVEMAKDLGPMTIPHRQR